MLKQLHKQSLVVDNTPKTRRLSRLNENKKVKNISKSFDFNIFTIRSTAPSCDKSDM